MKFPCIVIPSHAARKTMRGGGKRPLPYGLWLTNIFFVGGADFAEREKMVNGNIPLTILSGVANLCVNVTLPFRLLQRECRKLRVRKKGKERKENKEKA